MDIKQNVSSYPINAIGIRVNGDCWEAAYYGPHALQVAGLFGGHVLPTGFRASTDAVDVLKAIKASNPGVLVVRDFAITGA